MENTKKSENTKKTIPSDPLDATIVAFLWAEWFVKTILSHLLTIINKVSYWNFNRKLPK